MDGLALLIEQTEGFIADNPSDIAFTHQVKVPDGAGGNTWSDVAGSILTVRLVPENPSTATEQRTVDGEVGKTEYTIVSVPGADIREGDWFLVNAVRYEVTTVLDITGRVQHAKAVRRG
jgi:hypothetical protein